MMKLNFKFCLIMIILQVTFVKCARKPMKYNQTIQNVKYENPAFVKDRYKKVITKPQMSDGWIANRSRTAFNPMWMDYCDPYHCNEYHRVACGLNRKTLRFKWFQSLCHLIMNNKCAQYRMHLKYDLVSPKHCRAYVMFLRSRCQECDDEEHPDAVCGMSVTDHHVVLFKNKCALDAANCDPDSLDEYIEVEMNVCALYHIHGDTFNTGHEVFPTLNKYIY